MRRYFRQIVTDFNKIADLLDLRAAIEPVMRPRDGGDTT
jgi:hypothetical protein